MLYMVTFTIHVPQMLAYIAYMDPMGSPKNWFTKEISCQTTDRSDAFLLIPILLRLSLCHVDEICQVGDDIWYS